MNDKEKMEVAVIENEQLNKVEINENTIKNLIYVVRGKQVMLDSDLAMLYQVETGNLNKAMKRNINRFPEDFCFQLAKVRYFCMSRLFGFPRGFLIWHRQIIEIRL